MRVVSEGAAHRRSPECVDLETGHYKYGFVQPSWLAQE